MTKSTIKSTVMGKAYEYACVLSLKNILSSIRPIEVIENRSLLIAKQRYDEISKDDQKSMLKSALAGMNEIIKMEPKIIEDGKDKLTISLQSDDVAKNGDIRDVLIIRRSINWEIGISVKHNHSALKHSRLSSKLNFGEVWLGTPCSDGYFDQIFPIFEKLKKLKEQIMG